MLGWFEDFDGYRKKNDGNNRSVADIVLEVTQNYTFPILEVGEIGHNVENYVIPIGCTATIDADAKHFSIDEPTVV